MILQNGLKKKDIWKVTKMKIEFTTNGAAFCNPFTGEEDEICKASECIKIIEDILFKMKLNFTSGPIMDINGNRIGKWEI